MFMSIGLAVVYNYSAELFPTVVRNTGIGMGSACARFGGIISPFIAIMDNTVPHLSMYIMGIAGIIAGFAALLLPETKGQPLPETLEDGERFGKSRPRLLSFNSTPAEQQNGTSSNYDNKEESLGHENPAMSEDGEGGGKKPEITRL
ncbi:PREDICTED: solute carrier family 22 member 15-like [Priapulus caudatus]|uniref:Solute carrier family 22 member 15-like n=1 Tax=Priapulus caudatus TaxID=37621 RepID=A0ABM1F638_PRICU|nr:PREDICTED: solute carrier family 22 member 15-like [Priapulus caudatus]